MKKSIFVLFLMGMSTAALADGPGDVIYDMREPVVTSDYKCVSETTERTAGAEWTVRKETDTGITHSWQDGDVKAYFESPTVGTYKLYYRVHKQEFPDGSLLKSTEQKYFELRNGEWTVTQRNIQKLLRRVDGNVIVVSHKVDGEEKPYYWQDLEMQVDEKTFVWSRISTNPSLYNRPGENYEVSRLVDTCVYLDR